MRTIGIDIGTTSICLVLYDFEEKRILLDLSGPNYFLPGTFRQDPERIVKTVEDMLVRMLDQCGEVAGIGISSQMHGILYVNEEGMAVSDLFTWKETCGEETCREEGGASYLTSSTGYRLFPGYGTVTHYVLGLRGEIPSGGIAFTGIGDYLAMRLCGRKEPVADATMAASFGGYDPEKEAFDLEALGEAGVDTSFYPAVLDSKAKGEGRMAGRYRGIPVFWAVGDNQASFYGAAGRAADAVCVNVGTGSQVSLFDERRIPCRAGEIRPFAGEGSLYVQASLNGGKVYERLALFLEEVCGALWEEEIREKLIDGYELAYRLGSRQKETDLQVRPSLYGSRGYREEAGKIQHLTENNFHPGDLVRAYVAGMAAELHGMYEEFPEELRRGRNKIIASGNGIRRNELLRQEIEKQFGMPLYLSGLTEEAAAGAAILAGEWSR